MPRMAENTPEHLVLYVTYAAANMHLGLSSPTYQKLQNVIADFATLLPANNGERGIGISSSSAFQYQLVLLYQRTSPERIIEPFSCTQHAPPGAACGEYTREDTLRAFGPSMALRRKNGLPRRVNVGFWICALWLMEHRKRAVAAPFVWYFEDDVFLPRPWTHFLSRYDRLDLHSDLLAPAEPYKLLPSARPTVSSASPTVERSNHNHGDSLDAFGRPTLSGIDLEFAIACGNYNGTPTQLSIPPSTLESRLPVSDQSIYAKVPLYVWRMSGRLVNKIVRSLQRGARAHEEFFVPTACNTMRNPACKMRAFDDADQGVPLGANERDAWQRMHERAQTTAYHDLANLTSFRVFMRRLQQPGIAFDALATGPQRLYHPVKGQLPQVATNALSLRRRQGKLIAGGV